MALFRASVAIFAASGLPDDAAYNTFWFDAPGGNAAINNILDLLEDLYATEPDADPLITLMSDESTTGFGGIGVWNMDDPEPRTAVGTRGISATPANAAGLPAEIALCASFQGARESGEVQARRRGRIYVPFLTASANDAGRPSELVQGQVAAAMEEFWNAAEASTAVEWVVYSRAGDSTVSVADGWVDNAWDVQRRRGLAPTTRVIWPAP